MKVLLTPTAKEEFIFGKNNLRAHIVKIEGKKFFGKLYSNGSTIEFDFMKGDDFHKGITKLEGVPSYL